MDANSNSFRNNNVKEGSEYVCGSKLLITLFC